MKKCTARDRWRAISQEWPFIGPAGAFMAVVFWYLLSSPFARTDFPLDDAWIHRTYARAFSLGQGLAYNYGQQETGATSPLWVITTAPAHWLGGSDAERTVVAVKFVGTALGLVCLWLVYKTVIEVTSIRIAGTVAAGLFAFDPKLVFSALSGMETLLVVALALASSLAIVRGRWMVASILVGLLPVARPEAALALPIYFAAVLWFRREALSRKKWVVLTAPCVPSSIWVAFCLSATGHPFPTTYYLKTQPYQLSWQSISTAWQFLTEQGLGAMPAFLLGLVTATAWPVFRSRCGKGRWILFWLALPLAYALGVVGGRRLAVGAYYFSRWLDPAILLLTATSCLGLGLWAAAASSTVRAFVFGREGAKSAWISAVFVAILSVLMVTGADDFKRSLEQSRFHLWSDSRAIRLLNVEAGLWIRKHVPAGKTVAVNDAGAIRYFGERKTLDLLGLNYADLAFGRINRSEAFHRADWIAIFPHWFAPAEFSPWFESRKTFTLPLTEYTVCNCPSQTMLSVMQRRDTR